MIPRMGKSPRIPWILATSQFQTPRPTRPMSSGTLRSTSRRIPDAIIRLETESRRTAAVMKTAAPDLPVAGAAAAQVPRKTSFRL
jgi:hypothetical protein